MWEKFGLTDRIGLEGFLRNPSGYATSYGLNFKGFFKPFKTDFNASGNPHYFYHSIATLNSTGFFGASASGLNPYGLNTLNDGILSGTGVSNNLGTQISPTSVRSLGIKTPNTLVGWGYDIFGYPAPNFTEGWNSPVYSTNATPSGAWGDTTPSSGFRSTTGAVVYHGSLVSHPFWLAGPIDLRWDQHRGVWCGRESVRAGHIIAAYNTGQIITDFSSGYFAENLTYDIQSFDGLANTFTITGISHIGPKPEPTSYKVFAWSSGSFCFVVQHQHTGLHKPKFGMWTIEPPDTEACTSLSTVPGGIGGGGGTGGDITISGLPVYCGSGCGRPWDSSGWLIGSGLFDGLAHTPMLLEYGGLGLNVLSTGDILIGSSGNKVGKFTLKEGSGISINVSGYTAASGIITIALSTGVAFIEAGVNTNITELQGLTTPLSIAQGGTSSTGKVWVDLTTAQTVGGKKTFTSGVRSYGDNYDSLAYGFYTNQYAGMYYAVSTSGVGIATSGLANTVFNPTGVRVNTRMVIKNDWETDSAAPVLVLHQNTNLAGTGGIIPTGHLIEFRHLNSTLLGYFDHTGTLASRYYRIGVTGSQTTVSGSATSDINITLPNIGCTLLERHGQDTPTLITGNISNYQITPSSNFIRLRSNAHGYRIDGLSTPYTGRMVYLTNAGTGDIIITHNNFASATYPFWLPIQTNMVIRPYDVWTCLFDGEIARWRVLNGYEEYLRDPIFVATLFDDFAGGRAVAWSVGNTNYNYGNANGGNINHNMGNGSGEWCGVQLLTGTGNNGKAYIHYDNDWTVNGGLILDALVALDLIDDLSNTCSIAVGANFNTSVQGNQALQFKYTTNHSGWICESRGSAVSTETNTNVLLSNNTWYHLRLIFDTDGNKASFYINDMYNPVATHTGNFPDPTIDIIPMRIGIYKTSGTTERILSIDMTQVRHVRTSRRLIG